LGGSGEQAARHQQVAEAVSPVAVLALAADHDRLARLGEGQLDDRLVDGAQAVEQELRVEAGGDVLARDGGLDRLLACASSPSRRRG
jgi:hypothetical protein